MQPKHEARLLTCHPALQLVRLADDEVCALALHEKAEQLDLAVHVAAQGGDHAVGDLLGRAVPVVLLMHISRLGNLDTTV